MTFNEFFKMLGQGFYFSDCLNKAYRQYEKETIEEIRNLVLSGKIELKIVKRKEYV